MPHKNKRRQHSQMNELKIDSLFTQIETEMGLEPAGSYEEKRIERILARDMDANKTNSERHVCRGEIYYIIPENEWSYSSYSNGFVGGRPAVIVSNDMNNSLQGLIEVVYLSTHPRNNLPTGVIINSTGCKSTVLCDQICTIPKKRLGKFINECTANEMKSIDAALTLSLSLNLNDKNISKDILESWKKEIESSFSATPIEKISEADDEKIKSKSDELCRANTEKMSETSEEKLNGSTMDILSDIQTDIKNILNGIEGISSGITCTDASSDTVLSSEYMKACVERDTYKELYTELLNIIRRST